jgi:hypothetical protein
MLKRLLAVAMFAALLAPAVSHAADSKGKWALGYWDPSAPLGVRYKIAEKAAIDLGFGFQTEKIADDPTTVAAGDKKTNIQFNIEAGIPLTLVKTEHADFFFRPGILLSEIPYYDDSGATTVKKTASDIAVTGTLGAEWHVTDNLSLSVGHGIRFTSVKGDPNPIGPNEITDVPLTSETSFSGQEALDVTRIGFHWYFN